MPICNSHHIIKKATSHFEFHLNYGLSILYTLYRDAVGGIIPIFIYILYGYMDCMKLTSEISQIYNN